MFDIFYFDKKPNLFAHEQKVDSIEQAHALAKTRFFWIVNYLCDYTEFDFLWEPTPWENHQRHVWASQWQVDSGTWLVPTAGYAETNYRPHAVYRNKGVPLVEIDHLDQHAGMLDNTIKQFRYYDSYLTTLTRIAKSLKGQHEYVWVCSSVCDYSNFDFTWHPEVWQSDMLHVFPSNEQKFGDTFYMHVPSFADNAEQVELLDWYNVNYVQDITVPRHAIPVVRHTHDTHVEAIKTSDWIGPLALFTVDNVPVNVPTVSLWGEKTKTIVPLSPGARAVIVPKPAKTKINTQLYDYKYINKSKRHCLEDQPLDVVFISNGEYNALFNWQRLCSSLGQNAMDNRVVWSEGVKGRVAAYHAAAHASTTPWFFAVFAKLEVDHDFDWTWQPDRMQQPKHYIFYARNPVNGLEYGHQAMIAYNKQLVLNNTGHGLDFTLDSAHEVVPIVSGTANYVNSAWMAWRTAFRECIKLQMSTDVVSQHRLSQWLKENNSDSYVKWCHIGAHDAVNYFQSVNGDFDELRKSYDWEWLASYALFVHNLTPDL